MDTDYYQPTNAVNAPNDTNSPPDATDEAKNLIQETVERIISDLGFTNANDEQKQRLIASVSERVSIAVAKAIFGHIPEDRANALMEKIENNQSIEKDVEDLVRDNPELAQEIQNEVGALYEKMLEESEMVWKNIAPTSDSAVNPSEGSSDTQNAADNQEPKEQIPTEISPDEPIGAPSTDASPGILADPSPTDVPDIKSESEQTDQDNIFDENTIEADPQTPENDLTPASSRTTEEEIVEAIKSSGRFLDQQTLAGEIYKARLDGRLIAVIPELDALSEADKTQKLADWDWEKASEILDSLVQDTAEN